MTRPVRDTGLVGVLEVEPSGHRLQYVRHVVDAAGQNRCLLLTSEAAVRSEEFATHAVTGTRTMLVDGAGADAVLGAAVDAACAAGAGRLVVLDGDLYLLALLGVLLRRPRLPLEIRVLLMRTPEIGGPEPLRPAVVVKPVVVRLLRLFRQVRVLFLTDAWGVVTRRRGFGGVPAVRDPVVPPALDVAGRRPSWFPSPSPGTAVAGVFGVISERKNVPLLLDAVARVPSTALVIGGRLDPEVRDQLRTETARALTAAGRLIVVDRMLAPAELAEALSSVHAVAVLHDNDTPSGILAEACLRGTPVIVPAGGWLERVVSATGVGVATPLQAPAVAEALAGVVRDRGRYADAARRATTVFGTASFTGGLIGP